MGCCLRGVSEGRWSCDFPWKEGLRFEVGPPAQGQELMTRLGSSCRFTFLVLATSSLGPKSSSGADRALDSMI
jgi:hypothetical protein